MELYNTIHNFLKFSGIKVSKRYLKERLESHLNYPSLKSITDTLDDFRIENQAIQLENKEQWTALDFPFLAHMFTPEDGQDFRVIKNKRDMTSKEGFYKKWTGIVLLLDENGKIIHEEHDRYFKKEKLEKLVLWATVSILSIVFVLQQVLQFELALFLHFLLSVVGLFICGAIIAYSMGTTTDISDMFCKVGESGCKKVLGSKLGHFGGGIGLGDVAAIFFGSMILYPFLAGGHGTVEKLSLLLTIQSLAVVFTLVSIFYQWHLGSWCKLCLATIFILWLQMINLIIHFDVPSVLPDMISNLSPKHFLVFGTGILLASFWLPVKPLLAIANLSIHQSIRIRKWREDPKWFDALLPLHKKVDDSLWEKEIYYGNPNGVLQFLIVSNPYCPSCAKAHHELHKILDKHPEDIGVRIRFTMESFDVTKKEYVVISKILNVYEELVWKNGHNQDNPIVKNIITDWFTDPDIDQWQRKYDHSMNFRSEVDELIKKSIQWSQNMFVSQTPAFFINGYEMPEPHTFKDVFVFVSDYIDILNNK
ncbi:thioredoxin domain-containing protein [Maribacter sp. 2304DJ31-5]|uniref:thioredoxin domain-containing protein n=1 Tax=Maribacter sp. 2304DJ31-5 TaxID=3386273 RepID=UPI0039BD0DF3